MVFRFDLPSIKGKFVLLNYIKMKVLLDVRESDEASFLELLKGLDYVSILKEVKDRDKSRSIQDLAEAFNDVKLYEEGKKELKSAQELLDEL